LSEAIFLRKFYVDSVTHFLGMRPGNIQAIKIILDRILPPKKDGPIFIDLPLIKTGSDILEAVQRVGAAISHGELSPSDGDILTRIIDRQARAIEMNEFEQRLKSLEDRQRNSESLH
jgi:hypothetical protein